MIDEDLRKGLCFFGTILTMISYILSLVFKSELLLALSRAIFICFFIIISISWITDFIDNVKQSRDEKSERK